MGEEKKRKKKEKRPKKIAAARFRDQRCIIGRCSHCARRWLWLCVGRCGPYTPLRCEFGGENSSEGVFKIFHTKTFLGAKSLPRSSVGRARACRTPAGYIRKVRFGALPSEKNSGKARPAASSCISPRL